MQEFKIEGDTLRRDARFRILSWGAILLLAAAAVLLFVLGVYGVLSVNSTLRILFVFTICGAVVGASILACREALHYAEREMVFVLDDNGIVRRRKGYADVQIAFSEIDTLSEEMRWLIVNSIEPRRKIAIPNEVRGFETIRAELTKHHALSVQGKKLPLKSAVLMTVSILSWAAVVWFRDVRIVIPAGVIAMALLALGSRRLWILLRRGPKRLFSLACIGIVWFAAFLLIYLRVVRP